MAQIAPNFIRFDQLNKVVTKEITLWVSEDYVGEYPFSIVNALGYPVQTGVIKAKKNTITVDPSNGNGIYMLKIGSNAYVFLKG